MVLVATASDVDTVMVDGEIVVCEGRHVLAGEPSQGSIGRSSSA